MRAAALMGIVSFGTIRKCLECQAAAAGEGFTCTGFGAGCFLPHAAKPAPRDPREPMPPLFILPKKA